MKLGTENRNKVIAAASLVAVAVVLMATRFSGLLGLGASSPATPAPINVAVDVPPQRPSASARTGGRSASKRRSEAQSLDPTLHTDLLKISEDTKYQGTGRNIFKVFVDIPKPIVSPATQQQQQAEQAQGPAPPPPPPPIELKYYGYATPAGGIRRIFLAQGEDVFIAKEGEIVDRRYKVVRISPNAVEILDVLSNNRQSIPLTQG